MHARIPEDSDFVPDLGLGPGFGLGLGPLPCLGRGCGLALGFGLDLGQLLARCLVLLLRRLHLSINFHLRCTFSRCSCSSMVKSLKGMGSKKS